MTIHTLDIVPGRSVGPITLGMTRQEVWASHPWPITSFHKGPSSRERTDDLQAWGVHVFYEDGVASFIEAHLPVRHFDVRHVLDGLRIDDAAYPDVLEVASELGQMEQTACGHEAPSRGVGLYRRDSVSDDPPPMAGVYVFPPR